MKSIRKLALPLLLAAMVAVMIFALALTASADFCELRTAKDAYGDVNGDGVVNNLDLTCLAEYLANYDEETGTSTVRLGPDNEGHIFDCEVASADYLASPATCTEAATYYYSCACGEKGTATFVHGDPLGHNHINGICTRCGDVLYTITDDRKTVTFGSYPQSEVADDDLKSTLDSLAGTLPTEDNAQNWTSYGYYICNEVSNFMWYQDVLYNGEKYRGVYFTSYRPYWTSVESTTSNTYQDDNGYYTSTVYWFKFEPLTWTVLSEEDGAGFLLCNYIIDSQAYQNGYEAKNHAAYIKGTDIYANNYEQSAIRAWLNDTFYNTAFTAEQQAIIKTTLVDNSARSTNPNNNATAWNNGINTYACPDTNDKIFLLSDQEVTNSVYGFSEITYSKEDTARRKQTTDYAQAQGAETSTDSSYAGNGWWWRRSPNDGTSGAARRVRYDGSAGNNCGVDGTSNGIVPALQMIF